MAGNKVVRKHKSGSNRDYAVKNKVGNRDGGRPVRSIKTQELESLLENMKKGGKVRKRDRNIIERELTRRSRVAVTVV